MKPHNTSQILQATSNDSLWALDCVCSALIDQNIDQVATVNMRWRHDVLFVLLQCLATEIKIRVQLEEKQLIIKTYHDNYQ